MIDSTRSIAGTVSTVGKASTGVMDREAAATAFNNHLILDAFDQDDGIVIIVQADALGDARIVGVNSTLSRLTGYTEAELRGSPLARLRGPFTDGATQSAMDDAIRAGARLRGDIELSSRSGRPFWLGFTVLPATNSVPQVQHCVILGRDITEKRKRDHEQATIQSLLAAVFHKVDSAVVIVGDTGHVLLPNPVFQAMVGYNAGELSRMTVSELTAPEHRVMAERARKHQFETGEPYEQTIMTVHKDGTHIPVRLKSVIAQPSGKQRFRIVTLHPVAAAEPSAAPSSLAVIGTIQFVGLDAVKAAYGARWNTVRDRLMMMAESVLKRRLSGEDVFTRTPEDGFNIWFKHGTEDENACRLAKVVREVRVKLLGELGEETSLTVDAYTDVAELEDPAAPQSSIMATLNRNLLERRQELVKRAETLLERVMAAKSYEMYGVTDLCGKPTRLSFVDLAHDIRGKFVAAMSLVGGPTADVDTDVYRLGLAAAGILEDRPRGQEATYLFTLPFVLFMTRKGRVAILNELRALPPTVRAGLVVVLSELPPDIGPARVTEIATLLRPVVKGVGVMLDDLDGLAFQPAGTPFCLVGLVSESMAAIPDAKLRNFIMKVHLTKAKLLVRLAHNENPRRWQQNGADLTTAY